VQDEITVLKTTSAGTGLKIYRKKTELTKINTTSITPITVGEEPSKEVGSIIYLGRIGKTRGFLC
jgi:hypothetical protein